MGEFDKLKETIQERIDKTLLYSATICCRVNGKHVFERVIREFVIDKL